MVLSNKTDKQKTKEIFCIFGVNKHEPFHKPESFLLVVNHHHNLNNKYAIHRPHFTHTAFKLITRIHARSCPYCVKSAPLFQSGNSSSRGCCPPTSAIVLHKEEF